jgi:hypothetical protein
MRFLRPLHGLIGMFHGLLGMFMPRLMIFFPVMRGGRTVRVRGEFVELGSSLVRVIWHTASYPRRPLHLGIIPFSKLFTNGHSRRARRSCRRRRPSSKYGPPDRRNVFPGTTACYPP